MGQNKIYPAVRSGQPDSAGAITYVPDDHGLAVEIDSNKPNHRAVMTARVLNQIFSQTQKSRHKRHDTARYNPH